jgi:hypothetical protein
MENIRCVCAVEGRVRKRNFAAESRKAGTTHYFDSQLALFFMLLVLRGNRVFVVLYPHLILQVYFEFFKIHHSAALQNTTRSTSKRDNFNNSENTKQDNLTSQNVNHEDF